MGLNFPWLCVRSTSTTTLSSARQSKAVKNSRLNESRFTEIAYTLPGICISQRYCKEKAHMNPKALALIAAIALSLPAVAQTASQDMKNAGSDTKHAATSAGHGVSSGTKTAYHKTSNGTKTAYDKTAEGTEKGYHKTVNGTKTGYHKTAHATKTGVNKVEGKPNTPANNPPR